MRSQYRRRLHPGGKIDRVNEKAVHFGAVFAFEFCFLNARQFELLQPHIVLFGQVAQVVFLGCEDFIGAIRCARTHDHFSILAHVISGDVAPAANHRFGRAAGNWNAQEGLHTVILQQDEDRFAIGGPTRLNNVAIQILREHFRFTTRRRNNGESVHGIFDFLWIAAVDVSDSFTIGTPSRCAFPVRIRVGFRRGGNLPLRRSRFRADHPDVPIDTAVRIVPALRHECDFLAVRRPSRQEFVVFAGGENVDLARD